MIVICFDRNEDFIGKVILPNRKYHQEKLEKFLPIETTHYEIMTEEEYEQNKWRYEILQF